MIDSQLLGTLKRKELVELAASMKWSGWTRLSKADLLEFVRAKLAADGGESSPANNDAPSSETAEAKDAVERRAPDEVEPTPDATATEVTPVAPTSPVAMPATTPETTQETPETPSQLPSEEPAPVKKKRGRKPRKSAPEPETPLFDVISQESQKDEKPKRGRRKRADKAQENGDAKESTPEGAKGEVQDAPPKRARRTRAKKTEVGAENETNKTGDKPVEDSSSTAETPSAPEPGKRTRRPYTRRAKKSDAATGETTTSGEGATSQDSPKDAATNNVDKSTKDQEKPKRRRTKRAAEPEQAASTAQETNSEVARDQIASGEEKSAEPHATGSPLDVRTDELIQPEVEETREHEKRQTFITARDKVDRLLLIVCDPYWLRACWELSDVLLERVRSAMGRHWHTADPVLRVYRVEKEASGSTIRREQVADVIVRLELNNWYVQVDDPPQHFMVELGYLARDGQFFTLVSSNHVTTPQRFIHDAFSRPVFSPLSQGFEPNPFYGGARIGRPRIDGELPLPGKRRSLGSNLEFVQPVFDQDGRGGARLTDDFTPYEEKLQVSVDAEVIIRGKVSEGATVKIKDEPIIVNSEGAFSVRFSLPERRHVYPVVATTGDGSETRTIILAIDRNTKALGSVFREDED